MRYRLTVQPGATGCLRLPLFVRYSELIVRFDNTDVQFDRYWLAVDDKRYESTLEIGQARYLIHRKTSGKPDIPKHIKFVEFNYFFHRHACACLEFNNDHSEVMEVDFYLS